MSGLQVIQEVATKVGIGSLTGQKSVHALKEGYPIQFFEGLDRNNPAIRGIIRFDDETKDKLLKDTLMQDKTVIGSKLKPKSIDVKGGIVSLKWPRRLFIGFPKPAVIADQFLNVLGVVKSMTAAPGMKCRVCNSNNISGPILINGMVDRMCPGCIDTMKKQIEEAKAAYDALPTNIPLAILVALVLAVLGAVLWGGVIVATHKMYWAIAIVVGLAIGWAATKAAGKGGLPVQVIVCVATLVSVVMGMIFFAGYTINAKAAELGQRVDWMEFAANLPAILLYMKENLAFSLIGGGVGAFYAAAKAAKPKLEVKVQN